MFYPTTEAHYLTVDGDVLDRIAREYYGTEHRTTEQLLRRNPWVAEHFPVMSAGLILVLPVLDRAIMQASTGATPPSTDNGTTMRRLWSYQESKLWRGGKTSTDTDANALAAYRRSKQAEATAAPTVPAEDNSNPPELTDFDWLAVYYRDSTGKWKLGRIHRSNVEFSTGGYGYTSTLADPLADGLL